MCWCQQARSGQQGQIGASQLHISAGVNKPGQGRADRSLPKLHISAGVKNPDQLGQIGASHKLHISAGVNKPGQLGQIGASHKLHISAGVNKPGQGRADRIRFVADRRRTWWLWVSSLLTKSHGSRGQISSEY